MGSLALNEVHRPDGGLVVMVRGIVDDATVECFERGLDRATGAGSRQVIVDLSACRLDSAGFAALIRLWRRSTVRARATRLVVPDVSLFRMLQIVGLTSQFPTFRTMDAALPSPIPCRAAVATRSSRLAGQRGDGDARRISRLTSLGGAAFPFRAAQRGVRAVQPGSRGGSR